MRMQRLIGRLGRLQQDRRFKIGATLGLFALTAACFIALLVAANAPGMGEGVAQRARERARERDQGLLINRGPIEALGIVTDSLLLTVRPIEGQPVPGSEGSPPPGVPRRSSAGAVTVAGLLVLIAAGLSAIVWLGIGISALGLFVLAWVVAWPLMLWGPTALIGRLLMASAPLALAFITGMAVLKMALAGPWPMLAVARNVLSEAVRMKVSLVFIVLLVLLLSYAPQVLHEEQPLRYRVQTWLQYGMGLSYVVLAMLTLFLSVGTVAFEQRDKVIWQTMTKPVPPWQYLLGKWIGVMALNAVLLGVTSAGVYLFTEYLRHQPAHGEMAYHVRQDGAVTLGQPEFMTDDRRLLESQVLVARVGRSMEPLFSDSMLERAVDDALARRAESSATFEASSAERARARDELRSLRQERLNELVEARLRDAKANDPGLNITQSVRAATLAEIMGAQEALHRTIPPGGAKVYLFTGLAGLRGEAAQRLTLRYRINAGSNDPAQIYRLRFLVGEQVFERQSALGSSQTLLFDRSLVGEDGSVMIAVENAAENPREVLFPPDGMEILAIAGGYEANFIRIVAVMWIKLGFTAAVGIAAASFLSFSVACLVALTVLLAAESAGYLADSLEYYVSLTKDGIDYVALVVRVVAVPISRAFKVYADLRPTTRLVDGRLVGWDAVFTAVSVVGTWTVAVLGLGWAIFRNRELATYSGR